MPSLQGQLCCIYVLMLFIVLSKHICYRIYIVQLFVSLHTCYHTLFVKQHICHSVRNYYQHICRYVFVLACHNSILMSYCQIRMIRIYAAYMPLFGVHSHSFWIIIGLSPFFLLSTTTSHSNSIYALYD